MFDIRQELDKLKRAIARLRGELNVSTARTVEVIIDGRGNVITTGIKGDFEVPVDLRITEWSVASSDPLTSGSIQLDLWKCSYSDFDNSTHPVSGDSVTGSDPPKIVSSIKGTSSALTGWTTEWDDGEWVRLNVDSVTDLKRVTLSLSFVVR